MESNLRGTVAGAGYGEEKSWEKSKILENRVFFIHLAAQPSVSVSQQVHDSNQS